MPNSVAVAALRNYFKMLVPPINELSAALFTVESAALWLALAASALMIDLAAGQFTTRRIPSIETGMRRLARLLIQKLDRPSRTLSALRIRGFLTIAILLPMAVGAGLLLNYAMVMEPLAVLGAVAIILPVLGQKQGLNRVIEAGKQAIERPSQNSRDPHHIVRAAGATAVLDFTNKLVPRSVYWCLGGFALLLPQLLLCAFISEAEKRRSGHPESPFFTSIALLHEIVTAPLSIFASSLVALAHFFLPATNLSVFSAFFKGATFGPVSRYFPLNVIAVGLGLSVEAEIGENIGKRKAADREIMWIGPKEGRAQLLPADLKKIWLVIILALVLYFVISAMIFSLLLLSIAAD